MSNDSMDHASSDISTNDTVMADAHGEPKRLGFLGLPREMQDEIIVRIPLLTDQINFALALAQWVPSAFRPVLVAILGHRKRGLSDNNRFSRTVFSYPSFATEVRSPRALRPKRNNPRGLTYTQLYTVAITAGRKRLAKRWSREKKQRLLQHWQDALTKSSKHRRGIDKPSRAVREKPKLAGVGYVHYKQLIDDSRRNGQLDLSEALSEERRAEELDRYTGEHKEDVLLYIFHKLVADANYLGTTCRGCGNEKASPQSGGIFPHCTSCIQIYADQNLISSAKLKEYYISVEQSSSKRADWLELVTISSRTYISKEDADTLATLYHGTSFANLQDMVVHDRLSEAKMSSDAKAYELGAMVAVKARDHWQWPTGEDMKALKTAMGTAFVDTRSLQFWTEAITFGKQAVARCQEDLTGLQRLNDWVEATVQSFYCRISKADALHKYDVVRADVFDELRGIERSALGAQMLTVDEVAELHRIIQGPLPNIVEHGKDVAKAGLKVYLAYSAAVSNAIQRCPCPASAEVWIDLVALVCGVDEDLSTRDTRFTVFYNRAMRFLAQNYHSSYVLAVLSIEGDPQELAQDMADHLLNGMRSDTVVQSLKTWSMGKSKLRFLVPSDVLGDGSLAALVPPPGDAALEQCHAEWADEDGPDLTLFKSVGRIAWRV